MSYKITDIITRTFYALVSLFYMVTNGVGIYFMGLGVCNFIPKIIKYYGVSEKDLYLVSYLILSLICIRFLLFFVKNFIKMVEMLVSVASNK